MPGVPFADRGRDPVPALSSRQLLVVYLVVLLGTACLWYTNELPAWARPSYYGIGLPKPPPAHEVALVDQWFRSRAKHYLHVDGYPTLVVGDSPTSAWLWQADVFCFTIHTAPAVLHDFRAAIGDRHYAQIVLWSGTAHFLRAKDPEAYLDSMEEMVRVAREHTDHVFIIGPMPVPTYGDEHPKAVQFARISRVVDVLRERVPEVPIYDPIPLHAEAEAEGLLDKWYTEDGYHFRPAGFRRMGRELAARGLRVAPEEKHLRRHPPVPAHELRNGHLVGPDHQIFAAAAPAAGAGG